MSELNYEILDDIQKDVAQTLATDLSDVGVSAVCEDYDEKMAQGLSEDGVYVLVSIPDASFRNVQSPRVILDPIRVAITVTVTRGQNKPAYSASAYALKCAQNLVMRTPTGCNRPLVFSDNSDITLKHDTSTDSATVVLTTSSAFPASF